MTALTLRVVWPIHDDAMRDAEAIAAASLEWADFAEDRQVTVTGPPRIRVVQLDAHQRLGLRADRAVVCDAPVIRRQETGRRA